jgi:DNA-binding NtrC family response regulator
MRKRMEALIQEMLDGRIMLAEAVGEFEKIYIQKALERNGEHLTKTADILGIHRNTLSKHIARNGSAKRPAKPRKGPKKRK